MNRMRSEEVTALLDEYVCLLDRRDLDAWLGLFTDDGYYAAVREPELEQGNNVLLIGEDMKRLRARIASGIDRDRRRMVHTLSGVRCNAEVTQASASFTVWYDGAPTYAGMYLLDLRRLEGALRIQRCRAVLHSEIVHTPIFLPI